MATEHCFIVNALFANMRVRTLFSTVDELDRTTKEEGGIYEETKKEKEAKRKDDKKMQKLQEKLHTDDERMWFPSSSSRSMLVLTPTRIQVLTWPTHRLFHVSVHVTCSCGH